MAGDVPDLPGVKAPAEGAQQIQRSIMALLKRHTWGFPGAQPVSFARRHLKEELVEEDYFVCEKSDGVRCLMYLEPLDGEERVYLVTRQNDVFWVPDMHVPLIENDPGSFHNGSLIDGELVRSKTGELKYLMFDMLAFNGESLVKRVLDKRLGYLRMNVYKPFQKLVTEFPEDTAVFPFRILMKPMELSYGLAKVLSEQLTHQSDGLIFTSRSAPYIFGTDPKILKWKPADENSVDFSLKLDFHRFHDKETGDSWLDYDAKPECELLAWSGGDSNVPYGKLHLEAEEWEKLKARQEPLNRRVVECVMDDEGRWRYLRFRDDKDHGNHLNTIKSVIESIRDHVTDKDLLDGVEEIRSAWHRRSAERRRGSSGDVPDAKRHHS